MPLLRRHSLSRPALAAAAALAAGIGLAGPASAEASTDVPDSSTAPASQCPPDVVPTSDRPGSPSPPASAGAAATDATATSTPTGASGTDPTPGAITVDELVAEVESRISGPDAAEFETCCVGPLLGEVGAVADCRASNPVQGGESWLRFTATDVDGDDISYRLRLFAPGASLERVIPTALDGIDDITCPEDLIGEVDAAVECVATVEGEPRRLVVTVSTIDGLYMNFDIDLIPTTSIPIG